MVRLLFFGLVLIFPLLLSCSDAGTQPPTGVDAYDYTAFDDSGVVLVKGWFTLVAVDSVTVEGEWNLKKRGDPQNIGPQEGEGTLLGSNLIHDLTEFLEIDHSAFNRTTTESIRSRASCAEALPVGR